LELVLLAIVLIILSKCGGIENKLFVDLKRKENEKDDFEKIKKKC